MNCELTPELLLSAYAQGIFAMADHRGRLHWLCPDPRAVIPLDAFHAPRNLQKTCRANKFQRSVNRAFESVIDACADRPEGTWISSPIRTVFLQLHQLGFAHSVETWSDGKLVGGLYGLAIGGAFCGESMFHRVTDASKVALVHLVRRMRRRRFTLLDIQFITPHLERFGAREIPRDEYLQRLQTALEQDCAFGD